MLFEKNTRTLILHRNVNPIFWVWLDRHRDQCARRRITHRVVEQIAQNIFDAVEISQNEQVLFKHSDMEALFALIDTELAEERARYRRNR